MDRRRALSLLAVAGIAACDPFEKQRADGDDAAARSGASQKSAGPLVEPFRFGSDLDAGIKRASTEKRPLLVFFSASWNMACKELQRVFASPEVVAAAARFIGVLVDVSDQEDPKARKPMIDHGIKGVPAVLVVDSTGKEVHRADRHEPAATWVERLAQVK